MTTFEKEIQGLRWSQRRFYARLMTDAQRQLVGRMFARHRRSCESLGMEIDPAWLREVLDDVRAGYISVNNEQ